MLKKWEKILNEKNIFYIMLVLVVVYLIPVYMYACYTVPLADDFFMAGPAYQVWTDTESIWKVLVAAWNHSINRYLTWAGEYVCMFLQGLPVGLGDYRLYFLSSWINVSIFVYSIYYAGRVFFVDYLKVGYKKAFIVTSVVFLYMITFLPEIYDAFYWHTTVVSYTLSFAVKLIVLAGMFKSLFMKEDMDRIKQIFLIIGAFTAGGFECSFSQTSFFLVVSAFAIVVFYKRRRVCLVALYWVMTTIGWGIALLAPGNMVRQNNNYGGTTSIVSVIWESMHRGMDGISENINIVLLLVTLLLLPMIYKIVKQFDGKFLWPGLLSLFSIAVYASTYAPWVFSRGVEAPSPYGGDSGYIRNVFWMTFVVLWFVNVIYWVGWFVKSFELKVEDGASHKSLKRAIAYYGALGLLLVFWSVKLEHVMEYTSPRLLWHIANGNARNYYTAMELREEQLLGNTEEVLVVPEIEMPIPTRGAGDILSDENHWVNQGVAAYYKLKYGVKTEE